MSIINGLSAMGENVARTMAVLSVEERRAELEERRLALANEMARPERERAASQWERKFASDESLHDIQKEKLRAETRTLNRESDAKSRLFPGVYRDTGGGMINSGEPPKGDGTSADRIAGIESGGKYDAIGPVANDKGQRAYGKYQVMDFNIGPWTKEVLGKELTPKEFLADPEAQDAVFKNKFGQYEKQYGSPEAASRAWFAGPGGMNNPNASDVNGMTVANYEKKFSGGTPPASAAPGGKIAPATEPLVGSDGPAQTGGQPSRSSGGPPAVPDVARPQVTPEMARNHALKLQAGKYGTKDPGEALKAMNDAMEKEVDSLWTRKREAALKKYEQDYKEFERERKKGDDDVKRGDEGKKTLFEQEGKMRDDFVKEQPVKAYRIVVPLLESARGAQDRPTRAADLNLVYAFAKMMDPESVVRESETGAVTATASVTERLNAYMGQLSGQPMLNPDMRQKLMVEIESRFEPLKASHDSLLEQYTKAATDYGLNPDRIFFGVRPPGSAERTSGRVGNYAENAPSQKELETFARGDREAPQGALPTIRGNADYDRLKPGTHFIDPEGEPRMKPYPKGK